MEQTELRNYQQATLVDLALPYMAGLMDGEGCFTVLKVNAQRDGYSYRAYITLTNTDPVLIESFVSFLEKYEIAHRIQKRIGRGHKDCYAVEITGIASKIKFSGLMLPYLKGTKKSLASLLVKYLTNRLKRDNERIFKRNDLGRFENNGKLGFTEEDEGIYKEMKSIRAASETIRVDPLKIHTYRDKI